MNCYSPKPYCFKDWKNIEFFRLPKLLLILFLVVLLCSCKDTINNPELNESENVQVQAKGGKGGKGGNGGGGGKDSKDYGDLVVCLRDVDGIPIYEAIDGEHGLEYFPLPIKYNESTLTPIKTNGVYQTFQLNEEGDVILEPGFIVKEADFGRLNLVRAPQSVLNRALQEAKNALTQQSVTDIKTDASGRLVAINGNEDWLVNIDSDPNNNEYDDKTIDSPRENMAIYQELMNHGFTKQLAFLNDHFVHEDVINLSIGALAAGTDKTGNMIVDEIAYINDWIIDWTNLDYFLGPDEKDRRYFDFSGFVYNRASTYGAKYVEVTILNSDGTWTKQIISLLNAISWTNPIRLIDYSNGANTNISGYANATDDAVQVLEFIHSSELIVYNPYFTP